MGWAPRRRLVDDRQPSVGQGHRSRGPRPGAVGPPGGEGTGHPHHRLGVGRGAVGAQLAYDPAHVERSSGATGLRSGAGVKIPRILPGPAQPAEGDSVRLTLGAEEEFLLVDESSGALAPRSAEVLGAGADLLGDAATSELNLCQVETESGVCSTLEGLRTELGDLRRNLATAARRQGLAPLASGSHPFSSWRQGGVDRSVERYAGMEERFQLVAREQVICGCHVHVGVPDPDLAVAAMTRARPWLPVLLALSANSPFWEGVDSGYASFRTLVWQRWPTARMPPALANRAEHDATVECLVEAGAIPDGTYLYWYIRPSVRFPTLEFRVTDVCLDVDDTVAVAGLARALVWVAARDALGDGSDGLASGEVLRSAVWRAARYGLGGELLHPEWGRPAPADEVVARLLEHVGPGLDAHGDGAAVRHQVARILERGNGATWQRRAAAEMDGPALVARMRGLAPGELR